MRTSQVAIAGTFDLFHNGHLSLLKSAIELTNSLPDILIASNPNKGNIFTQDEIKSHIENVYSDLYNEMRVHVPHVYAPIAISDMCKIVHSGFAADYTSAKYMVRSIKGFVDFDSEQTLAGINEKFCGVKTIWINPSNSEYSSSAIKQLFFNCYAFDEVSRMVPYFVFKDLCFIFIRRIVSKYLSHLLKSESDFISFLRNVEWLPYHNYIHVARMLALYERFFHRNCIVLGSNHVCAIILAIIFHDIFQGVDPERRSADYMVSCVRDTFSATRELAYQAIMSTANHTAQSSSIVSDVVCDLDLSIFAADKDIFDEYNSNIYKEYGAKFSEYDEYHAARKDFMSRYRCDNIYKTNFARSNWESTARHNLISILM